MEALDRSRPEGWLSADAFLRDLNGEARANLADCIEKLEPTLHEHPRRRVQIGDADPVQVWLCRAGTEPSWEARRDQAEIGCLVAGSASVLVIVLTYGRLGTIARAACWRGSAPSMLQSNYARLQEEAERQRARLTRVRGRARAKSGWRDRRSRSGRR